MLELMAVLVEFMCLLQVGSVGRGVFRDMADLHHAAQVSVQGVAGGVESLGSKLGKGMEVSGAHLHVA